MWAAVPDPILLAICRVAVIEPDHRACCRDVSSRDLFMGGARSNDERAASLKTPPVRVFAGLMVAPEIARELVRLAACLGGPAVRLVAVADVHVTLIPPWREASVPGAIEKLRLAARACEAFWLTFRHVGYGPDRRRPRMLWADCAASESIATLRASLLQAYGQIDERLFRPHVTLARIRGDVRRIARRHPMDLALSFTQRVETVELFQSPFPGESGYRIAASAPLGETARGMPPEPVSQ
jgi:2'-5' RNA ligase